METRISDRQRSLHDSCSTFTLISDQEIVQHLCSYSSLKYIWHPRHLDHTVYA